MSISASEKEEWAESERDRSGSEGPSDLQEELIRVMNKSVQELELAWNPPEEIDKDWPNHRVHGSPAEASMAYLS